MTSSNQAANDKSSTIHPQYLSVRDAATYTSLSEWTLRREVYAGRLASRKFGSRLLIPKADLDQFLHRLPSAARNEAANPEAE